MLRTHAPDRRQLRSARRADARGTAPAPRRRRRSPCTPPHNGTDPAGRRWCAAAGDRASGDPAVDEALRRGRGARWRCSPRSSAASSYDGRGAPVVATVHYEQRLRQRVLGRHPAGLRRRRRHRSSTGSPSRSTCSATSSRHAVTEYTAGLAYEGQSGALNESMSDVFGSCLKQRLLGQTRRRGRLADRRGPLPAAVQGRGAARHGRSPARRTTTRCSARTRRARTWTTTSRPPTTTAACTLTPASPTGRSTSRRPRSAARLGGRRAIWYAALTSGHRRGHRLRGLRGGHRGGGRAARPSPPTRCAPPGRRSA